MLKSVSLVFQFFYTITSRKAYEIVDTGCEVLHNLKIKGAIGSFIHYCKKNKTLQQILVAISWFNAMLTMLLVRQIRMCIGKEDSGWFVYVKSYVLDSL